ncbi:MAG: M20/M25/M40 family metallo-hydrolase [Anaerolineales bacterium]|nr:M20/M25/M40 family metallo-hydrolase [Anaerolineales bacterium]
MSQSEIYAQIDAHIEANLDYWIEQLARLVNQRSISAQNDGIDDCAQLVAAMLQEQGFTAEVMPSAGYPVVYGEGNGRSDKTLLFYLHYDVQPAEPVALWNSPPFELTQRGNKLYGRGISDDKGHIICRLAALAAVKETLGELPCNVKFFIEGEEEIGSSNIPAFVEKHQEKLAADGCIWEFGSVDYDGHPQQVLGMRGICYVELSVQTANQDAHSGLGGSLMPNAAWRLTWALNTLKDQNERILIPGFYDNVQPPSATDIALLEALPDTSGKLMEMYGISGFLNGMTGGLEMQKTAVFTPTCTICGITTGYQGPGSMTVQPAKASAKIDFRLVPNQTPDEIVSKLRAHLDANGFDDVEITVFGRGRPAKVDPDHPLVHLAYETAVDVYGKAPRVSPLIGGSGPNYPFIHVLHLPVVSAGIGYPGSQVHAPNENITIDNFIQGTKHTARIIEGFAERMS